MSVHVPFQGKAQERATLLLAEAEKSEEFRSSDVRTVSGAFVVPKALAEGAGLDYEEPESPDLRIREADIPEPDDTVEVTTMGAGPTGAVKSNVDFDEADSGTVQNRQGEQEMGEPRSDPKREEKRKNRRRPAKKAASEEKDTAKEKQE